MVTMIRSGYCLTGHIQGTTNRLTGIGSVFIGCCAIFFETLSRRIELALYLAPKAIEGSW